MSGDQEFRTAFEIAQERERREKHQLAPTEHVEPVAGEYVVAPVMTVEQARKTWNDFLAIRGILLDDPNCFDVIEGGKEMNRTGATRLATAFGLSIELLQVEEGRVQLADSEEYDYRFRVRVRVSKGARFVDGIGSCRIGEITAKGRELSWREHAALTKAQTRATKRAIADILGGTEAE